MYWHTVDIDVGFMNADNNKLGMCFRSIMVDLYVWENYNKYLRWFVVYVCHSDVV